MSFVGPTSTSAGISLLQAALPQNLPRDKASHLPQTLPEDPASLVGANPNSVITRNDERIQQETAQSGGTAALDVTA